MALRAAPYLSGKRTASGTVNQKKIGSGSESHPYLDQNDRLLRSLSRAMPSNIEIKARAADPARLRQLAERLSDSPPVTIAQRDTFFACTHGRLKLREFSPTAGELIFYTRADAAGTRQSDYLLAPTDSPASLRAVLAAALGERQTVVKTRVLLLAGQTRIHLDEVAGLGSFVELEVVLRDGQSPEEGHRIARELMTALEIRDDQLLAGAYADLLPAAPGV